MKARLLEHIYEQTQEACMSDLKNAEILKPYVTSILQIDEKEYEVEEWMYAYTYLTGCVFKGTIEEIKQALLEWVK